MKTLSLCFAALLISISTFAQNPNLDYKKAIKGYNQITYSTSNFMTPVEQITSYTFDFLQPVAGLQWKNKRNEFHELTLSGLNSSKREHKSFTQSGTTGNTQLAGGQKVYTFHLALTYEYQIPLLKNKKSKVVPSAAIGINPYFDLSKFETLEPAWIKRTNTVVGAKILLIPRLTYYMSPKLFLDLNIPFCLADYYSYSINREDATAPGRVQGSSSMDMIALPKVYDFRIGLGFKI